jgi:DNA-binding transcriptional regulator/RsmH inhibitor MraZ
MASRAELVELCKELEINHEGFSIQEMTEAIRKEADRRWGKFTASYKKFCSTNTKSKDLLRFLTEEYDYSLFDRDGNRVNVDSNIIKEAKDGTQTW